MKKLNFDEMNELTRLFNQQGNRLDMVNMIKKTANVETIEALGISESFCYGISLIFDILFKNKIKNGVSLDDIFYFIFDNLCFVKSRTERNKPGSYQIKSSIGILSDMYDAEMIGSFQIKDIDYAKFDFGERVYTNLMRKKTYDKLIKRMEKKDFICARVCFGQDSNSDHAILVCKDNKNYNVVIDTSWRGHLWPQNDMDLYINNKNILWFTEII